MDFFSKAKGFMGAREPAAPAQPARKPGPSYHAVAIAPGPQCCALARRLAETRFLSTKAPPLPLAGCNRADCTCRYVHFADRRGGPRRAHDMGVAIDGSFERENEQRGKLRRGRRGDEA